MDTLGHVTPEEIRKALRTQLMAVVRSMASLCIYDGILRIGKSIGL